MLQTIRLHIPRFVDHPFTEIRNELNIANICSPGIVLSCCTPRTNNESTFLYVRSLVLLFPDENEAWKQTCRKHKTSAWKLCKATEQSNSSHDFWRCLQPQIIPLLALCSCSFLVFWLTCRSVEEEVKNNGSFTRAEIKRMLCENWNNLIWTIYFFFSLSVFCHAAPGFCF